MLVTLRSAGENRLYKVIRSLPAQVYICIRLKQTISIFEQTTDHTAVLIKLQPQYYDTKQNGLLLNGLYTTV